MKFFDKLRSRGVALKTAVAGAFVAASVGAHAELPAWATAIATDATDAVESMAALIGPVVGAFIIVGIVIKVAKRLGNKI